MYALRNRVQLIGHVGKDPELKETQNGKTVCRFSVATNDSYVQNGSRVVNTEWHNVVVWGKIAESVSKIVKKGQELALEGKLSTRTYQDKDGNTKNVAEITLNDFLLVGKKDQA